MSWNRRPVDVAGEQRRRAAASDADRAVGERQHGSAAVGRIAIGHDHQPTRRRRPTVRIARDVEHPKCSRSFDERLDELRADQRAGATWELGRCVVEGARFVGLGAIDGDRHDGSSSCGEQPCHGDAGAGPCPPAATGLGVRRPTNVDGRGHQPRGGDDQPSAHHDRQHERRHGRPRHCRDAEADRRQATGREQEPFTADAPHRPGDLECACDDQGDADHDRQPANTGIRPHQREQPDAEPHHTVDPVEQRPLCRPRPHEERSTE